MMAGAAEPGVPGGALSMKPMITDVFGRTSRVDGQCRLSEGYSSRDENTGTAGDRP